MRLPALASRRVLTWAVAALVLGPPVLIGLFLLLAFALKLDVKIELAHVLAAVAVNALAVIALLLVHHRLKPKRTVSISYNFKLEQPRVPVGRYRFLLEVWLETEEKGESRRTQQGRIEMLFRRRDHPDLFDWCRHQIGEQLERHREMALSLYPDAVIVVQPPPERVE